MFGLGTHVAQPSGMNPTTALLASALAAVSITCARTVSPPQPASLASRRHPPPARWAPGQCHDDLDCPPTAFGPTCVRQAPGGVCVGCIDDAGCPRPAICIGDGICASPCEGASECPRGMRCGSDELCHIARCVVGRCPDRGFACSGSGLCVATTGRDESSSADGQAKRQN